MKPTAIVIGAGIVGLATARALAVRGFKVSVFERSEVQTGASVRNFGMIWPIGQPGGKMYDRAMQSRYIWKQICDEAGIWYNENGSLHLAYHDDELNVMGEFAESKRTERSCSILTPARAMELSPAINPEGLIGALWSKNEMLLDPREAIVKVAAYLEVKYGVSFHYNTVISHIEYPSVHSGLKAWSADEIYVCSGADFETLYPEIYLGSEITKCKLQMLRFAPQPDKWNIGPSLCGGLSLIHYGSFKIAPSLDALRVRYEKQMPEYIKYGIHVMAAQNGNDEITVGDSHEYGLTHDPFDRAVINDLIINYLKTFAQFKNQRVIQTWNGVYPKMTNGSTELLVQPEQGVTVINSLGGAGMTLSFGLAEQYIGSHHQTAPSL